MLCSWIRPFLRCFLSLSLYLFSSPTVMCLYVLSFDFFILRINSVRNWIFLFHHCGSILIITSYIALSHPLPPFPSICMHVEHFHHFSKGIICIFLAFAFMYLQIFYGPVFYFLKSMFFLSLQVLVLFYPILMMNVYGAPPAGADQPSPWSPSHPRPAPPVSSSALLGFDSL